MKDDKTLSLNFLLLPNYWMNLPKHYQSLAYKNI